MDYRYERLLTFEQVECPDYMEMGSLEPVGRASMYTSIEGDHLVSIDHGTSLDSSGMCSVVIQIG